MANKYQPWHPAPYEWEDAHAIQAVAEGRATPEQQKAALRWIVYGVCKTYERTFVEGHPEASRMIEGRREAGLDIVKLCNLDLKLLQEKTQRKLHD